MSIRVHVPIEQAEWSVLPPAEWVRQRSVDWAWRPGEGQGFGFLLIDEQHHVASQALYVRTVKMLTSLSAVQTQSQVVVEFDPAAQRLQLHELAIWRMSAEGAWQKREPVAKEAFLLRQREQQFEQQMLKGYVSLVALLEDVRVGDVIDLSWTLLPREPLPGLLFTALHFLAWSVPVATYCLALTGASGCDLRWRLHTPDGAAVPVETSEADGVSWRYDRPPMFQAEGNVPGGHWPFPVLEATCWQTWGQVARFFAELWADAANDAAESVAAEAQRLADGKTRAAAIVAALRFVQNDIRYLSVDFGHGAGMLPNGAGTVLRRRFGDCKDKSILLAALLRELGIAAWPVLVASGWRDGIQRLMPSTACFNHVIVGFELDGQRYFADPTVVGQGGDLERLAAPPFGAGLQIDPATDALLELPPPALAELTLTETFTLDRKCRDGAVDQVLEASGWLADDIRAAILNQGQRQFAKQRADALQQNFPALLPNPESMQIGDDSDGNRIELRSRHGLPTWGQAGRKPPDFFSYGAHGLFLAVETIDPHQQRAQPFQLRHPLRVCHSVVVRGKAVKKLKAGAFTHEGPGFRYRVDVRSRRREVRFDYRWESTAAEIAAEQWPEYCQQRAAALERAGALVHTPAFKPVAAALRLFPVLAVVGGLAAGWLGNPGNNRTVREAGGIEAAGSKAFEHVKRSEFSQAYSLAAAVQPNYRNNFDFLIMFSEAAIRTGHFAEAEQALVQARSLRAGEILPEQLQAALFEARGQLPQALELLKRLAGQAGAPERVYADLARVSERTGEFGNARAAWETVLSRHPAEPEALYSLARLLWLAGERERGDSLITGVIASQPVSSAALEGALARYFAVTGRPERAIEPARRASEREPGDPYLAYKHVRALIESGRHAEALAVAIGVSEKFPRQPMAAAALATAAAMANDNLRAEPAFKEWVELAPDNPDAVSSYGFFLHRTGRDREAQSLLEAATHKFPAHGNLWLNYSVVLDALGDTNAAEARQQAARLMTDEQRATLVR
ncbi:DUF3857 domain-containing protein [Methylomonas koyamae]|uniref:DUF3857 domain-containing protein n=1 Tax=Methylomonas koyamae TaxID=702114 RepID=UPI000BC35796|nr:DUF3857 domain-containing protein [Methylomonas koyamae]ATG89377.1 hypothetical protein MKLM6_1120 [Methylomonas koyamae]